MTLLDMFPHLDAAVATGLQSHELLATALVVPAFVSKTFRDEIEDRRLKQERKRQLLIDKYEYLYENMQELHNRTSCIEFVPCHYFVTVCLYQEVKSQMKQYYQTKYNGEEKEKEERINHYKKMFLHPTFLRTSFCATYMTQHPDTDEVTLYQELEWSDRGMDKLNGRTYDCHHSYELYRMDLCVMDEEEEWFVKEEEYDAFLQGM